MTGPAQDGFRFALRPATSIYYAQAALADPPNPRLAFLPPDGAPLPLAFTLAESWAVEAGVYLFVGAAAASTPTFAAGVRAVVSSQPWTGTRLLWITDPNAQVSDWQLAGISLVELTAGGGQLATLTVFPFRDYACLLNGGLALTAGAAGPEFSIAQASTGDIRLTTDSGATELPLIQGPLTIPLTGPAAGCLTFAALLPVGDGADGSIDALDVGCRFFFDDPDLVGTGAITSRRYPVFDATTLAGAPGAATAIELAGQFDPVAPLDGDRSCLTFSNPAPLRSYYRTSLGSPLDLAPVAARLQFAVRPAGQQPTDADPLYLVPHGSFTVQPPPAESAPTLLCGVGGAEYRQPGARDHHDVRGRAGRLRAGLRPGQHHQRRHAGAAADRPGVDLVGGGDRGREPPVLRPAGGRGAVRARRRPGGPGAADGSSLLPFFELQAATLPRASDAGATTPYPLVPHAGVSDDLTSYERLEVQVLSQQRRQVIIDLQAAAPPPAPVVPRSRAAAAGAVPDPCLDPAALTAGTPQGLIASFSADKSSWACLKLAQSVQQPAGGPPVRKLLALQDVTDPLRSALLTNQQFIVVSDPSGLPAVRRGPQRAGDRQLPVRAGPAAVGAGTAR